jgi:hypothetical protein
MLLPPRLLHEVREPERRQQINYRFVSGVGPLRLLVAEPVSVAAAPEGMAPPPVVWSDALEVAQLTHGRHGSFVGQDDEGTAREIPRCMFLKLRQNTSRLANAVPAVLVSTGEELSPTLYVCNRLVEASCRDAQKDGGRRTCGPRR